MTTEQQTQVPTGAVTTIDHSSALAVADSILSERTPKRRGYSNLSAQDLSLPRLSLNGKHGYFRSNLAQEQQIDHLQLVALFLSKSRILFDKDSKMTGSEAVLCRSANAQTPVVGGGFAPKAKNCFSCPFSEWKENKTPPECREQWNFLVVDPDQMIPMCFTVHGTSIAAMRRVVSQLNAWGCDMFGALLTLETEHIVRSASEDFYTVKVASIEPFVDPQLMTQISRLSKKLKDAQSIVQRFGEAHQPEVDKLEGELSSVVDQYNLQREAYDPYEQLYSMYVDGKEREIGELLGGAVQTDADTEQAPAEDLHGFSPDDDPTNPENHTSNATTEEDESPF